MVELEMLAIYTPLRNFCVCDMGPQNKQTKNGTFLKENIRISEV